MVAECHLYANYFRYLRNESLIEGFQTVNNTVTSESMVLDLKGALSFFSSTRNPTDKYLCGPPHGSTMNNYVLIALVAAVAVVLAVSTVTVSMAASEMGMAKSVATNRKFVDYNDEYSR
jgi:hypothetical protein